MRTLPVGIDQRSACRHPDWTGPDDLAVKIIELRELAKRELGTKFDLRAYHDLVLKNGALPMNLLEENVRAWIKQQKG